MAVIDLTDDPRLDMAMAQSIGNILKSVGQAEQNRQNRYKMDQIMSDINSGSDPLTAIQGASNIEAPRDKGLAGVWQGAGRLIGGKPRNTTDAMIEKTLMGKLQGERNRQLQLKETEGGFANYDPRTGTLTPTGGDVKPRDRVDADKAVPYLQGLLDKHQDNMTAPTLNALTNQANKLGYSIQKADVTNYLPSTPMDADGRRYNEGEDGSRRYITPKYAYQLVAEVEAEAQEAIKSPVVSRKKTDIADVDAVTGADKPAAKAPSGGGEVVLQDETGRVIGTMPDLPDRTYVEIEGKTFTIPNDQLNDFRSTYPEASVYQIHKK
jgi:hypothetical protein